MWRFSSKIISFVILMCAVSGVISAPITYSFSTSVGPFGTFPIAGLFDSNAVVSGTFSYNSQVTFVQDVGTGLSYGGHTPGPGKDASFSDLIGAVSGMAFSDPRGVAIVGNNRGTGLLDSFALSADPSLTSTSPRNISGFTIGDYTLVNVRLFWIEGQSTPGLIPDFLDNELLPAAPPVFDGRLALDFVRTGTSPSSPDGYVFFDGLTVTAGVPVSEPGTFAMLFSSICLLAVRLRRRTASTTPT